MSYRVRLTREAEDDLERLVEFVLKRELERNTGDRELADKALIAINLKNAVKGDETRQVVVVVGIFGLVRLTHLELLRSSRNRPAARTNAWFFPFYNPSNCGF